MDNEIQDNMQFNKLDVYRLTLLLPIALVYFCVHCPSNLSSILFQHSVLFAQYWEYGQYWEALSCEYAVSMLLLIIYITISNLRIQFTRRYTIHKYFLFYKNKWFVFDTFCKNNLAYTTIFRTQLSIMLYLEMFT